MVTIPKLKVILVIVMALVMVLAIRQVYEYKNLDSVLGGSSSVDSKSENNTFVLWRINAAVPGSELRLSIEDEQKRFWKYDIIVPKNLPIHPTNPGINYHDYYTYLPVHIPENTMAIMCITLTYEDVGYECTETFITKNMARGIVYYNSDLIPDPKQIRV